jgi:hypothetical protein
VKSSTSQAKRDGPSVERCSSRKRAVAGACGNVSDVEAQLAGGWWGFSCE